MSNGVVIRIGYHKCGSTHLGLQVLPNHSQIRHLGKPYGMDDPVRELIERIMGVRPFELGRCRELAETHVTPYAATRLVSISDNRLSSCSHSPDTEVPARLHAVFGRCRILVTIRRHRDFVKSLYVQDLGTRKTDKSFEAWMDAHWSDGICIRESAAFAPTICRYQDVFGKERVWLSLLEQFGDDLGGVADSLGTFLDVDAAELLSLMQASPRNPRMSVLQARLGGKKTLRYTAAKAVAKRLPPSVLTFAAKMTGHDRRYEPTLGPQWDQALEEMAREDGAALLRKCDLPLARYGYSL